MPRPRAKTFRRQVLHQFVQGHIADYNPFEPELPTQQSTRPLRNYGSGIGGSKNLRFFQMEESRT